MLYDSPCIAESTEETMPAEEGESTVHVEDVVVLREVHLESKSFRSVLQYVECAPHACQRDASMNATMAATIAVCTEFIAACTVFESAFADLSEVVRWMEAHPAALVESIKIHPRSGFALSPCVIKETIGVMNRAWSLPPSVTIGIALTNPGLLDPSEAPSLCDHPQWPACRTLERIEELLGKPQLHKLLLAQRGNAVCIDIGAGSNPQMLLDLRRKLHTAAPSTCDARESHYCEHKIELAAVFGHEAYVQMGLKNMFQWLPVAGSIEELFEYEGRTNIVVDVFGAFSYASNPIEVLILELALLREGGTLFIVTETERLTPSAVVWPRLAKLLRGYGFEVTVEVFDTKADARGVVEQEMRVRITRKHELREQSNAAPLDMAGRLKVCTEVLYGENGLGAPTESARPLWRTPDAKWCILAQGFSECELPAHELG